MIHKKDSPRIYAYHLLKLTQNAVLKIVTDIIPVLSLARTNTQIIGIVHRKDRFAGVSYINAKVESRGETAPIIEFRENISLKSLFWR